MSNSQEMIKSAVVYTIGIYEVPIITEKTLCSAIIIILYLGIQNCVYSMITTM